MPRKKTFKKLISDKKLQKFFFCSGFLKLSKLEMLFQKQDFYFLDERDKQTWEPLITQMGRAIKNCSKTRKSMIKTGRFHIKL